MFSNSIPDGKTSLLRSSVQQQEFLKVIFIFVKRKFYVIFRHAARTPIGDHRLTAIDPAKNPPERLSKESRKGPLRGLAPQDGLHIQETNVPSFSGPGSFGTTAAHRWSAESKTRLEFAVSH